MDPAIQAMSWLYGTLIALLALSAIWVVVNHYRFKPVEDWLKAANLAAESAQNPRVGPPPMRYKKVEEAVAEYQRILDANEILESARHEPDEEVVLSRLARLNDEELTLRLSSVDDITWAQNRLRELTVQRAERLIGAAREGSQVAMTDLIGLTTGKPSQYRRYTGDSYAIPRDWDNLIARLYENPNWTDFRLYDRDPLPNAVRLMVAETLASPDLTRAKLLFSFCAAEAWSPYGHRKKRAATAYRYHKEVIKRQAELADLVARLHRERGLFQELPHSTTRP